MPRRRSREPIGASLTFYVSAEGVDAARWWRLFAVSDELSIATFERVVGIVIWLWDDRRGVLSYAGGRPPGDHNLRQLNLKKKDELGYHAVDRDRRYRLVVDDVLPLLSGRQRTVCIEGKGGPQRRTPNDFGPDDFDVDHTNRVLREIDRPPPRLLRLP